MFHSKRYIDSCITADETQLCSIKHHGLSAASLSSYGHRKHAYASAFASNASLLHQTFVLERTDV